MVLGAFVRFIGFVGFQEKRLSLRFDASLGDLIGVPRNTYPLQLSLDAAVTPCCRTAARKMNLCSFPIFWGQAFPPFYSKNSVLAER